MLEAIAVTAVSVLVVLSSFGAIYWLCGGLEDVDADTDD